MHINTVKGAMYIHTLSSKTKKKKKEGVAFGPEQAPELVTQLKKYFVKNDRIGIRMMSQFGVDCRPLLPYIFDVSRTYDSGCVIEILLSPSVPFAKGFRGIPFHQYFVLLDIDFNYKDRNDQNLACWAVCAPQNELALLEFLHKDCNVDMTLGDKWGVNAALTAVIHKKLDCVRFLVDRCGVDINYTNNDGRTLAHECAERGCDAILEYLIQKGIDLSIKTKTYEKETAYDLANVYLQKKCVELLKPWKEKQKEQDSETESKQKE
ncbi:hypothetical protein RFI_15511 [Reticulomyxa filosa]|uniref:Uncharacterized protein n=1 Tax=Reticulomyxa filosa TaxID=46433 RepID=X6N8Q6_RETFI|nr:hypothetical protein RFI_15511 [Reticulomyxa filosa]|eukprot:ETO21692.1 hypothetical protein RFI_15511 [Reticulomyxa filosa]